jgi:preprotein translocase subunit SecA
VEAKERVRIQDENHTWATVTLQNYFRMYEKLAGMTGTAETEASEFASTYSMQVVPIPTNKPMIRDDQSDLIFKSEPAKFAAVVEDIAERFESGQPVLVGTASVAKSEELSVLLDRRGIPHHVLNAKQHAREAVVVAQAGRLHSVTVATNMAGRGVDILLGGFPGGLARDAVIGEELDPETPEGEARYGELLTKFEAECAAEGDEVRELGGLYVLGSERHESRRIDNQLRGRSGRQGDPGESRFFLSLEDELMRIFATGAMNWVMGKALPEDVPIEARMVTRAIEKAQQTVEARNGEFRKDTLKYDEVMNEQRKVMYGRRQQVIDGEDIHDATIEMIEERLAEAVDERLEAQFAEDWDINALMMDLQTYYPTRLNNEALDAYEDRDDIVALVVDDAVSLYEEKCENYPGGLDMAKEIERDVMLQILDQRWREHLSDMDYLRDGIHWRQVAQQDPLSAWQKEGYQMFEHLLGEVDKDFVRYITHVEAAVEASEDAQVDEGLEGALTNVEQVAPGGAGLVAHGAGPATATKSLKKEGEKIGRNEPCWCGSGRKFKQCHGRP